jgi:predicted aspartyl protease
MNLVGFRDSSQSSSGATVTLPRKSTAQMTKCAILRRVNPSSRLTGSVRTIFAALILAGAPILSAAPSRSIPDSFQFEALSLERSQQNHLLVRAFINGKPALLGVDTGAPVSALDLNRREHFQLRSVPVKSKLPSRVQINGAFNRVAIAHRLQLGALGLIDEPMVLIDLGASNRAAKALREEPIDGIVGADILFPTSAIVDCKTQRLVLKMDPNLRGGVPGYDVHGFHRMPLHVTKEYNLYVDGKVNGEPAKLMVDTGAFATLMHRDFIRRMKIPTRQTRYNSAGVNLRERGLQLATINQLSIGRLRFGKKEVGVMDLAGLIHGPLLVATPPVVGLLGSEILQDHHGIIDFGTLTLYLQR